MTSSPAGSIARACTFAVLLLATLALVVACSGDGDDRADELERLRVENEALRVQVSDLLTAAVGENDILRAQIADLTAAVSALATSRPTPPSTVEAQPEWDDAPEGYEEESRERVYFRVYGADTVTAILGINQNSCTGAWAIKFRTIGRGKISMYEAGWMHINRMSGNVGDLFDGWTGTLSEMGLSDADLVEVVDHAEYRSSNWCTTIVFAGDPDEPHSLSDVVMDVVIFGAVP